MQRKMRINPDDKKLLAHHAWQLRTNVSKLIRAKIDEYVEAGLTGISLPMALTTGNLVTEVSFHVEDQAWLDATARARADSVELTAIIRGSLVEDAKNKVDE